MQRLILLLFVFVLSTFSSILAQETYSITIDFSGMKSDKGDLYIALYNSENTFLKTPMKGEIVKISDKKATAVFKNIKAGNYAISAFHDENDNKKMDTKIFGIPKEPIGISNDAKGFFGPPKYKDAQFTVDKNISLAITIK
ncbi:DUF2141 domain-containing protein [Tenacibaculum jejuense]|nr:DUF2141 domain-containing protein [Tenacibaculum jejuense]